jgi:hypothetical protein
MQLVYSYSNLSGTKIPTSPRAARCNQPGVRITTADLCDCSVAPERAHVSVRTCMAVGFGRCVIVATSRFVGTGAGGAEEPHAVHTQIHAPAQSNRKGCRPERTLASVGECPLNTAV